MPYDFDAVFDDGVQKRVVGPFDSIREADEYGWEHHGDQLDYVGWAVRTGRVELELVIGSLREQQAGPGPGGYRSGVVTRWKEGESYGFITDAEGRSWFVSEAHVMDPRGWVEEWSRVSFVGVDRVKPGKKYPNAYQVRVVEDDG